jgi:hypothetical protein
MEKVFIKSLDKDLQQRLQCFEDREDLFETKVLKIKKGKAGEMPKYKILVVSRNPGSANALAPVMGKLNLEKDYEIIAMTDGKAQESFEKEFETEDISPAHMVLEADTVLGDLDIILIDSSSSHPGTDYYVAATYDDVPSVLVEDMYTANHNYLKWAKEKKIRLPEKICVIDEISKELIVQEFPDLADKIEITGQPAFDKFGGEKDNEYCRQARKDIGLKDDEKLIVYMATSDMTEKAAQAIAIQLKKMLGSFYFSFCKHPRDITPYEKYKEIFNKEGIKMIDAGEYPNEQMSAAADVVVTTTSTEGLHAVYRRKPSLYIADQNLLKVPPTLNLTPPLPPVRLGASAGIDSIEKLPETLNELIDSKSVLNQQLKEGMEKFYPRDGKNASRVVDVISEILKNKNKL